MALRSYSLTENMRMIQWVTSCVHKNQAPGSAEKRRGVNRSRPCEKNKIPVNKQHAQNKQTHRKNDWKSVNKQKYD